MRALDYKGATVRNPNSILKNKSADNEIFDDNTIREILKEKPLNERSKRPPQNSKSPKNTVTF